LLLWLRSLTPEAVEGLSLSFQGIDNVHSGDGLPLGMLGIGDCISNHVLEEVLQHTSGFLVDESADSLNTTSSGQSSNCRLGDSLDVVTKDFSVSLRSTFAESFSSFTASRHDYCRCS